MIDFHPSNPAGEKPAKGSLRHLLVFSDDWGRHPSSCQHLVRPMLNHLDVVWMNTIGMRPPRLDRATLHRGLEKLRQWQPWKRAGKSTSQHVVAESIGPRIINPLMWPRFEFRWERSINRQALDHAASKLFGESPRGWTILTTIPVVADVVTMWPEARIVYYCVDDFSTWPGLDGLTMARMEQQLVDYADAIVAAGDNLAHRLDKMGRSAEVISHGVDLEFWQLRHKAASPPPLLEGLTRPLIMFWGLIDQRLDCEWIVALDAALAEGTIVFVGPEQNPDATLDSLKHVRRVGPVSFDQLPALAAEAEVLVMPYANLAVTQAMQPLKLKEYLATGRPVVARSLPGTIDWHDCLDVVNRADDFVRAVIHRLEQGVDIEQLNARRRLKAEGWSAKSAQLEAILFPETASA